MKKPLLDVLFSSAKRKDTLLLLQDGPKETVSLLKSLGTTRQALLPQMRILEDCHLVDHKNDIYKLTTIGNLIVERMIPLLNSVETFDTDIDYWGTHNLNFIPPYLLKRLEELRKCEILNPCLSEMYEVSPRFQKAILKSNSFHVITRFAHPNFPELFAEMIGNKVEIFDIVTQDLFDSLLANRYDDFKKIIDNELVNIFVYPESIDFMSFGYNDYNLMLSLLTKNGDFDNKHLLCEGSSALQWGREIFEYYLKDSTPITSI